MSNRKGTGACLLCLSVCIRMCLCRQRYCDIDKHLDNTSNSFLVNKLLQLARGTLYLVCSVAELAPLPYPPIPFPSLVLLLSLPV